MEEQVYIKYPRGEMWITMTPFFPCTIQAAKTIFPLINTYATDAEKEKLRSFLLQYARDRKEEMKEISANHLNGYRRYGRSYSSIEADYKRALRNLKYLEV